MHVILVLILFFGFVVKIGETAEDAEKTKAVGAAAVGRLKKRPVKSTKSNAKAAWGKLLSQCSQVDFHTLEHLLILNLILVVVIRGC